MPRNDADSADNEDFWDRPRRTRQEDKRSGKKKKRGDAEPSGGSRSPLADEPPIMAPKPPVSSPPPAPAPAPSPRSRPRTPAAPSSHPPIARPPIGPPDQPAPPARRRSFDKIAPPRPPGAGTQGSRPTTSPRVASRRAAATPPPSGPPPGIRTGRPSGETPDLAVRLEGLASRGRLGLSGQPTGAVPATVPSPVVAPDYDDPMIAVPQNRPGRPYGDTYPEAYGESYSDTYDDDYDDEAETPKPGRGCLRVVVAAVLVVALLVGAVGYWLRNQINPGGELGDKVTIEVVEGESTGDIGEKLEDAGVITSASVWTWYVRFKGGGNIQAGNYELNENMSMGAALDALEKDPMPPGTTRVTVPPGFTVRQVVARLSSPENGVPGFSSANLDAALADPANKLPIIPAEVPILEGTLFPETYEIGEGVTEAQFIKRMVDEANSIFTEVSLPAGVQVNGATYSPYQVLIVASLIEEEIEVPEERAQLARLIYNRLQQDIALGIDATSCYGIAETPCNLADDNANNGFLDSNSLYDTRVRKGLPQTPISSPSRASIEAALHPAEGDWIYSVLDPAINADGKHHLFTSSAADFEAAKERCREAGLGCG